MRKLTACGLLVLVVLLGPAAVADVKTKPDPNDVTGLLDLESVAHGHGRERRLVHTLTTFTKWKSSDLAHESSWIALMFDRDEDSAKDDRFLKIDYSDDRGLHARMTTFGTHGPGEPIGRVAVWRPNPRTVKVRFPRRFLGRDLTRYEWAAIASYEDDEDCSSSQDSADQGGCIDYAPGKRAQRIVHEL